MKILVTGRDGQIGWELMRSLAAIGQVIGCDRGQADFSLPHTLDAVVDRIAPDVIVNAAAYTAVDKAEHEPLQAELVNAVSVRVLADAARRHKALFVHFSTDYVFDGLSERPYREDDIANPLNVYGRSKLAGEKSVVASGADWLIFRTSWVYSARGRNFFTTMLDLGTRRDSLRVVADQYGAPTPARWLADWTAEAVRQALSERLDGIFNSGLYHLSTAGRTSWHGFATAIFECVRSLGDSSRLVVNSVEAILAEHYLMPAARPKNSMLDNSTFDERFGLVRPSWEDGLRVVVGESVNIRDRKLYTTVLSTPRS